MGLPQLALMAASAYMQKRSNDAAVVSQANAANVNAAEQYRAAQAQEREVATQAAEQMTDRSREAARQLSMARVIAAEGGGSLAARAINIGAGASEDEARIEAGRINAVASIRGQMAATGTGLQSQLDGAKTQLKANRMAFFGSVASAAATSGASKYQQASQIRVAEDSASDYRVKVK